MKLLVGFRDLNELDAAIPEPVIPGSEMTNDDNAIWSPRSRSLNSKTF